MSSPRRRMETDVIRLLQSDYEIELVDDCNMREFYVRFAGPAETPFAGGVWKVHVELPEEYPYKSPSIGFRNRIFHPNIDEVSGSVCLDVINQAWTPLYQLENIFTLFLPHLLRYPNASDPLNGEAAALYMSHPELYEQRVREYVQHYASGAGAPRSVDQKEDDESEEEEMSDLSDVDFSDEDEAAQMEL